MFGALFVFPNEMRMVMKERSSGMYRLSAYYLARTLSDLPMDCFYPSLFVIIAYFMGGLRLEAWAFFANWATIILSLLVAQTLGLLLGAGVDNVKTAQTFATIFMLVRYPGSLDTPLPARSLYLRENMPCNVVPCQCIPPAISPSHSTLFCF